MTSAPWGAELIVGCTRAQAIAEGMLRDVTAAARAVGITLHTAMTAGAWAELGCDDGAQLERVLAAVAMSAAYIGRTDDRAYITLDSPEGPVDVWTLVGPGDDARPVLTVMLYGED